MFVYIFHRTKYYVLRHDGYKLFFVAAVVGVVLFFLGNVIVTLVNHHNNELRDEWHEIVPLDGSGRSAVAFLAGALLALPFNVAGHYAERRLKRHLANMENKSLFRPHPKYISLPISFFSWLTMWWHKPRKAGRLCRFLVKHYGREAVIYNQIQAKGNSTELVVMDALLNGRYVAITTKDDTVFVGLLSCSVHPAYPLESIQIDATRKYFLDPETRARILQMNYDNVIVQYTDDYIIQLGLEVDSVVAKSKFKRAWYIYDLRKEASLRVNLPKHHAVVLPMNEIKTIEVVSSKEG